MRFEEAYMNSLDRSPNAEREDSFLGAFGNKPGSARRAERRKRKGWDK
ncbi:hypothetical protein [Rhizobium phage RHph_I40]|uniref:Uncharacterized protein n=1 Tax=Rhizobium phage RHph_I38 TaxID=2509734 RepID=A0A7S5RCY4_9CAUD|nr:hypothetical protein EVC01_007 [Rhizobium phage RHph_I38]QXV73636.1 hypothetical protein [Rhizobium phage RHph_I40]